MIPAGRWAPKGLGAAAWALVEAFAAGCNSEATVADGYPAITAACEDELSQLPETDSSIGTVSAECADAVGAAFGLDWDSFGESAHAFSEATSPGEIVVGGLVLLVGTAGTTVEEAMVAGAPSALQDQLSQHRDQLALAAGEDSAPLWYAVFASGVTRIRYDSELGYRMAYYADGTVRVGDVTNVSDDCAGCSSDSGEAILDLGGGRMPLVQAAIILFHEATHEFYSGHGSCAGARTSCDPTPDGAYGAAAYWGGLWVSTHHGALADGVCGNAAFAVFQECAHINDATGYVPCGVSGEVCYTD